MAKPGHKVRAIGAPFDTNYSSCSNITPTNFTWSSEKGDWDIHIDRGMMYQPALSTPKEKRYGWVCESQFIVPDVYNFLIHNHKILFNNYYNKIFTCDQSLIKLNSNFIFCPSGSNYPWIAKQDWKIYNKTKTCSMFCSPKKMTEGHVYRHQLARMALDCGFDVFGGAHGTERIVEDIRNPWNTKINGVRDYKFSLVIENGFYDSYYTEKLTDCFSVGTIPVYWGTKNIPNIFDPGGIIWLEDGKEKEIFDSLNEDLYISKKSAVEHNFNALQKLKIADDELYDIITTY